MSARHGQGYTTWIIMLPLLIVPLIAVFGVPQFTLPSARTADGAYGEEPELQLALGAEAPLAESVPPFPGGTIEHSPAASSDSNTEAWSDPFENPTGLTTSGTEAERPSESSPFAADVNSSGDPFNAPAGPVAPTLPENPWAQPNSPQPDANSDIEAYSRDPNPGRESRTIPDPSSEHAPQLSWREAVARLNRLGVQKFQLSQTDEPFVFQFVCDLSRPDNPRVTHRFEARAGEPLKAVENVIQQVESWSAQPAPR